MSVCHMSILSLFRASFKWVPTETIKYRTYSKFSSEAFLYELDQEINKDIICNSQDKQYIYFQIFSEQF